MLLAVAVASGFGGSLASVSTAQQTTWQPARMPTASHAQPLATTAPANNNTMRGSGSAQNQQNEHLGSGVVLRWKTNPAQRGQAANPHAAAASSLTANQAFGLRSQAPSGHPNSFQAATRTRPPAGGTHAGTMAPAGTRVQHVRSGAFVANPLRSVSGTRDANMVRSAAYQQQGDAFSDPFGDNSAPADPAQPGNPPSAVTPQDGSGFPPLPENTGALPERQPPTDPQNGAAGDLAPMPDPLSAPEAAPQPGSILEPPTNPFPRDRTSDSPSDSADSDPEVIPLPPGEDDQDDDEQGDGLDLPNRQQDANLLSCNEQRDRVLSRPLTEVNLNVSPRFGEGLRSVNKDTEDERRKFAATSPFRDWRDYTGLVITNGRLIDLKDDHVVLQLSSGGRQRIPLNDLSDVDVGYVGDAWNIPLKCGTGNARYDGRNFVASYVQWKAPGHCHKPAYFEQPQLERYGHEVGPVLQPLISTAHFFGNIAVLPYKMGIHPPNECQYSLGYYRPGNCAPYMLQPIPLSLRGAAAQASVITGAAALIP